jgi:hypothetical protein
MSASCEIAVIGAGAAGLMAAIQAGRRKPDAPIIVLDGAKKIGAKILVSGGGRCNVTHDVVDETAFDGSSRHAIRKVLLQLDVPATIDFFRAIGVELKREEGGKLFPVTNDARTVLEALLRAAREAGADIRCDHRVETVRGGEDGYTLSGPWGEIRARRVVMATGGRSLPKSGSDGGGYEIARARGHTTTPVFPALVPLLLPPRHFIRALSGLSVPASIEVRGGTAKRLASFTGPLLCTHFGISGPAVLDVSRHFIAARASDPESRLVVSWLPGETFESVDAALVRLGNASVGSLLVRRLPDRLARALCDLTGIDPTAPGNQVPRERRRALAEALARMTLPIEGDRGFDHAEVTAGGIPLSEIRLETMESRVSPGLHICGEICDVDGRIGGYNFQWAWASGKVAGAGAAEALR